MSEFRMRRVGGCVRDLLLGVESHDIDFSVEGGKTFEEFCAWVYSISPNVKHIQEETYTVKAKYADLDVCDFVWARKEGPNDSRGMPTWVKPGSFFDDAARRDFTFNAMMIDETTGETIDYFGGRADLLDRKRVQTVQPAHESFMSDARRVVRAFRFAVQFDLTMSDDVWAAFEMPDVQTAVAARSGEIRRDELNKALAADMFGAIDLFRKFPQDMQDAILFGGIRFEVTLKGAKR